MCLLRPREVMKMKPDPRDAAEAGLKPAPTRVGEGDAGTLPESIFMGTKLISITARARERRFP